MYMHYTSHTDIPVLDIVAKSVSFVTPAEMEGMYNIAGFFASSCQQRRVSTCTHKFFLPHEPMYECVRYTHLGACARDERLHAIESG